jgi:hypothetical protein
MNRFFIGFLALVAILIVFLITSYISANNYGASIESQLNAARENNQNILAQYQQKVLESVQVPDMYKNDLKEILTAEMSGRYGSEGSEAVFQFLQERALNFDSKLYLNLQDVISSGRKDFEKGQTVMIDIKRAYEASLNYFWKGMWLRISGYPKIDLNEYKPVITYRVEEVFKNNKESSPLRLRSE